MKRKQKAMRNVFAGFTDRMDALVSSGRDPHTIAEKTASYLEGLLAYPQFLEERFREPDAHHYRQHILHVHPAGLYSVVSLVWNPGQATPVHDHVCWCVVGVLQGRERETSYNLLSDGDEEWLVKEGSTVHTSRQVSRLVPPDEDVHKVENAGEGLAISVHIYGADIAERGTSINHAFNQPIRARRRTGQRVSWREHRVASGGAAHAGHVTAVEHTNYEEEVA